MHSYLRTDFPGLPVIQFLMILQIEINSINSTVRNRLLLQFIHFRNMLLEAETFHSLGSLHKTPRNFILLEEIHRILQVLQILHPRDSLTRWIILLPEAFDSLHLPCSTHPCIFKTFQGIPDILQGSTLFQHSSIRMYILPSAGFQKTPPSTS